MILLIQLNDLDITDTMINMLNEDNVSYQWMFLTKPESHKVAGNERQALVLVKELRDPNIGHSLKKIDVLSLRISYPQNM